MLLLFRSLLWLALSAVTPGSVPVEAFNDPAPGTPVIVSIEPVPSTTWRTGIPEDFTPATVPEGVGEEPLDSESEHVGREPLAPATGEACPS